MRITTLALAASIISTFLLPSTDLQAQAPVGFKVIVNPANPTSSLTAKQISGYFLRKTSKWEDGQKVLPVDLVASSEVRSAFSEAIHQKPVSAVKSYWAQSIFSGLKGAPPELKTEADVVAYVETHAGAIGYVSTTTRIGTAEVLDITD